MVDPRVLRISAALTTAVLALALVAGPSAGLPLMAVQTFVFAFGAVLGLQAQPYVLLARRISARKGAQASPEDGAAATADGATPHDEVAEVPFQVDQGIGMLLAASALLWGTLGTAIPFYVLGGIAAALALVTVITGNSIGGALIHLGQKAGTKASAQVDRLADAIDARAAARQAAAARAAEAEAYGDGDYDDDDYVDEDEDYVHDHTPATPRVSTRATDFYDFEADDTDRPVVTSTRRSRRADARVG